MNVAEIEELKTRPCVSMDWSRLLAARAVDWVGVQPSLSLKPEPK